MLEYKCQSFCVSVGDKDGRWVGWGGVGWEILISVCSCLLVWRLKPQGLTVVDRHHDKALTVVDRHYERG